MRCTPFPPVRNSYREGDLDVFPNTVNYTCHPGHQFPNAADIITINCTANGQWDGKYIEEGCTGRGNTYTLNAHFVDIQ